MFAQEIKTKMYISTRGKFINNLNSTSKRRGRRRATAMAKARIRRTNTKMNNINNIMFVIFSMLLIVFCLVGKFQVIAAEETRSTTTTTTTFEKSDNNGKSFEFAACSLFFVFFLQLL